MFPFLASQALAHQQAKQNRQPVKSEHRRRDPSAPVPPASKGRFRRLLHAVFGSCEARIKRAQPMEAKP